MEEKKSIKVSLGTVICIFIIILLIIALAIVYYLGFIKNDKEEKTTIKEADVVKNDTVNNQTSNEVEEENLDINSELIEKLYAKILKTNLIYNEFGTNGIIRQKCSFYKDTKVTTNNLSNEEKVITILQYLEENNKGTNISFSNLQSDVLNQMTSYMEEMKYDNCKVYSSQDIETAKNEIFGKESNINWVSIDNNAAQAKDYIDGKYYCYNYPGGGGDWGILSFSQIQKATKDNNYIYIYDKYLYCVLDYGNQSNNWEEILNFYTNSDMNVKLDGKDNYYEYENYFNNKDNSIINQYSEKLDTYKHTFKKDSNGNYYWVSTEIVKN